MRRVEVLKVGVVEGGGVAVPVTPLGCSREDGDAEREDEQHPFGDVIEHLGKVKEREQYTAPPLPPPVYWLRFGLTLVFAVGIALKDGPASLLVPGRRG